MAFWQLEKALDRVTTPEVRARLEHLDVPFNRYGIDRYGVSKAHLGAYFSGLGWLYHQYFRVRASGLEHLGKGKAVVVGNHSGGLPVDAAMVSAALFFALDPPRLAHGMVEKFAQNWPVVSPLFSRIGQLAGLPEHALRLLDDGRLLMVFPEGARGTGKLYKDKYNLVRFGTGFVRVAMQAKAPIVPFAFVGGEEALPTVYHARLLAKITGAPYWPVTPYVLPVPLPFPCQILFGEPMYFEGTGDEDDAVVAEYVAQVRARIEQLIAQGRAERKARLGAGAGAAEAMAEKVTEAVTDPTVEPDPAESMEWVDTSPTGDAQGAGGER